MCMLTAALSCTGLTGCLDKAEHNPELISLTFPHNGKETFNQGEAFVIGKFIYAERLKRWKEPHAVIARLLEYDANIEISNAELVDVVHRQCFSSWVDALRLWLPSVAF